MRLRKLLPVGVLLLPVGLAGCTVPINAVAGVGVGDDGQPLGMIEVCSEHIDGSSVYQTQDDHLGSWEAKPAATGFTSWSLADGGNGWRVTEAFAPLKPGQNYTLYGWTNDNSSSAADVDFTTADLANMKPGQVRYWSGKLNDAGTKGIYDVTTVEQFRAHACDRYR